MPRGTNPTLEIFLQLLFDWTSPNNQLYKSVTWTFSLPDGTPKMANYATQGYDDLIRLIETRGARPLTNVYVGLGTQRMVDAQKHTKDGYPKAIRQHNNIASHKSIWMDLDVKPDAYPTTEDALEALDNFITDVGLPATSMEVFSGTGGVHAYWCTDKPMSPVEWIPLSKALRDAALAYQLKFDPQVTVNIAGILRAPGTFNYKKAPNVGQVLLNTDPPPGTVHTYQDLARSLAKYMGPAVLAKPSLPQNQQTASTGTFTSNFTAGVENAPAPAIDDMVGPCGVVSDILGRGGSGDSEPLWNLALYLASFTSDPVDAAHRLSKGDARYTPAETDAKLNEKINARVSSGAGWPQCASFSPLHPACGKCPLLVLGKSPLNHAVRPQVVQLIATSQAQVQLSPHIDQLMPVGYWRNIDRHVETLIKTEKGDSVQIDVLGRPVLDAGIDPESGDLVIRTSISGVEKWGHVSVSSNLQPVAAASALGKMGIFVPPHNHKHARDFLVAWMTKLQDAKRYIKPATFGWTDDGKGFTFGDKTYTATGETLAFRGVSDDKRFGEKGELKPWQTAMQLVYNNPPLEAVVASAFAAPLMELIGTTSVVLSVYSHLSGVGKTTSMQLAQAVWGHPRTGMSSLDDTQNSVMKKVADLKSLPAYWDELRTMEQMEKIVNLVFSITQGKAKARLTRDIQQQEAGTFTTMFVIASNYGLTDTVYSNTEATEAGGLRVFEIEAEPLPKGIDDHTSRSMMLPLQTNYGRPGAEYGKFLATNRAVVVKTLDAVSSDLMAKFNFGQKERFWAMTVATLLVGAQLANHLGLTQFDIARLRGFMETSIFRQRDLLKTQAHSTMADPDAAKGLLNDMVQDIRGKNLLITDRINYPNIGRPVPLKAIDFDPSKLGDVWMQYGMLDGRYRVRLKPFNKWLRDHKQHPDHFRKLLRKDYIVTQSKQSIGSGVMFLDAAANAGRSECLDLTPIALPATSLGSSPGST